MEFKINLIFVVCSLLVILIIIAFVSKFIKMIREESCHKRHRDEKLYCHHCKLAYTDSDYVALHYKYCPECGNELQYIDSFEPD